MKSIAGITAVGLIATAGVVCAQQQKVSPPVATYWMSIDTASGLPMGGMGGGGGMSAMDVGRMMMGGGMDGGASRSMRLELGSQRAATDAPAAAHEIPSGLNMGASLPLETPQQARRAPREDGMPENFEKPRGRMLIYWGCGEQAGSGQPYVFDFAKLAQGEVPSNLFNRSVRVQRGPTQAHSRTYGDWPNQRSSTRVPADGSLQGDHAVKGNYSPDIRFSLSEKYDFMQPVNLAMKKSGAGAMSLSWNSVANAHGYFATAMGSNDKEDLVFWSSSDSRIFGEQLMSWLPPSEVARLIRDKVVMPAAQTECTVPAQFVAAAPSAFVRFIAYGEEANFAHPPRPRDPKVTWNPDWAVKVRLKSTASALLGEEGMGGAAPRARNRGTDGSAPQESGAQQQGSEQAPAVDPVQEGLKALKGLFGR